MESQRDRLRKAVMEVTELDLEQDNGHLLDSDATDTPKEGSKAVWLAGSPSPIAERRVALSPVHINQPVNALLADRAEPTTLAAGSLKVKSKGAPSSKFGRKFDSRRESVELTKYFEQLTGPAFEDKDDNLLAPMKGFDLSVAGHKMQGGLTSLAEEAEDTAECPTAQTSHRGEPVEELEPKTDLVATPAITQLAENYMPDQPPASDREAVREQSSGCSLPLSSSPATDTQAAEGETAAAGTEIQIQDETCPASKALPNPTIEHPSSPALATTAASSTSIESPETVAHRAPSPATSVKAAAVGSAIHSCQDNAKMIDPESPSDAEPPSDPESPSKSCTQSDGYSADSEAMPSPAVPVCQFPTKLLADFAATITPVRVLNMQAAQQARVDAAQRETPGASLDALQAGMLEMAIADEDDSPEQASPAPASPARGSSFEDALPEQFQGPKLASVLHFPTPPPLGAPAAPGQSQNEASPGTPFTYTPARWELWGEDSSLVPRGERVGPQIKAKDAASTPAEPDYEEMSSDSEFADTESDDGQVSPAAGNACHDTDDDEEEPIFAYLSATGIVTPAKAALTPATHLRSSTAKKSRFLQMSVPKQPFAASLPSAVEEDDEGCFEDEGPLVLPLSNTSAAKQSATAEGCKGAADSEQGSGQPRNAVAAPMETSSSPAPPTSAIVQAQDSAEQCAAVEQSKASSPSAPEAGQAQGDGQMTAPAVTKSAFANAEASPEAGAAEPSQLECLERLPSELLIDPPISSSPPLGLVCLSRSERLASGSLSRFASQQGASQDQCDVGIRQPEFQPSNHPEAEPAGEKLSKLAELTTAKSTHSAETRPPEEQQQTQGTVSAPTEVLTLACSDKQADSGPQEHATAPSQSSAPRVGREVARHSPVGQPSTGGTAVAVQQAVGEAPAVEASSEQAEPAISSAQEDAEVAATDAARSTPPKAASIPATRLPASGKQSQANLPVSRLRMPTSSRNLTGCPAKPESIATAFSTRAKARANEPSHIPRPSGGVRPPRASTIGTTGLPRLPKRSSGPAQGTASTAAPGRSSQPPKQEKAAARDQRIGGRILAASGTPNPQPSRLPTLQTRTGQGTGRQVPPVSRLKAPTGRLASGNEAGSSPPIRASQAKAVTTKTPNSKLDQRTPEYERMLNAALADEAMAFQGGSKKVANSPLEGGSRESEKALRLTAYDKHLREWSGEPLA